jgi:hypothetical protein
MVDPNAVLAGAVAPQPLHAIAERNAEIGQPHPPPRHKLQVSPIDAGRHACAGKVSILGDFDLAAIASRSRRSRHNGSEEDKCP